jgi:AcrR family transcriptional regulator
MRAMAAGAAFSRSSLYALFSGKEEILAALAT